MSYYRDGHWTYDNNIGLLVYITISNILQDPDYTGQQQQKLSADWDLALFF